MESAHFILSHNYFKFDGIMYLQLIGTAIGTIFAPPYACLTCGYLEETQLYPRLINHFPLDVANTIINFYYRYMDDGIIILPPNIDV